MKFQNLLEATTFFSDKRRATDFLIEARWHGKIKCVHCGHDKIYTLKGANKRFKCAKCREQFSAIKGSIFENSPLDLQKWFVAIYLVTSHKKGISSCQLARDLQITQKSAWFVLQRIRYALQSGTFEQKHNAIVECDETAVGGKEKNKHKSKWQPVGESQTIPLRVNNKTVVAGIIERGGNVTAKKVPDAKGVTLIPFIKENIKEGTTIVTDEHSGYKPLEKHGYKHHKVAHIIGEYVVGDYHTNTIENFWSLFKRGIIGIYHHVSDKHIDKYIDEFEFRFNTRKLGEVERFEKMLGLANKRLTYHDLTKK